MVYDVCVCVCVCVCVHILHGALLVQLPENCTAIYSFCAFYLLFEYRQWMVMQCYSEQSCTVQEPEVNSDMQIYLVQQ